MLASRASSSARSSPASSGSSAGSSLVLGIALFGPFFAPTPRRADRGIPFEDPSGARRSAPTSSAATCSRVLWGGRSVLALAGSATADRVRPRGLVIGLVAGYTRSLVDPC